MVINSINSYPSLLSAEAGSYVLPYFPALGFHELPIKCLIEEQGGWDHAEHEVGKMFYRPVLYLNSDILAILWSGERSEGYLINLNISAARAVYREFLIYIFCFFCFLGPGGG